MNRFKMAESNKGSSGRVQLFGWLVKVGLIAILLTGTFFLPLLDVRGESNSNSEEETEIYYKGKVTAKVNVRAGAGENNERIEHNNQKVQLQPGTEVLILDEVMVGDKPWYHIRFQIGSDTLEGYSTSSYINKTKETITPTPLPTPTPTLSPTPSPTPINTPEPTVSAVMPKENGENKTSTTQIIIITIGAAVLLVSMCGILLHQKKHPKAEQNELTEAVKKLQNVQITSQEQKKSSTEKLPEIRPTKKEEKPKNKKTSRVPGVYVKNPSQSIFEDLEPELTPQERIDAVSKENEEKKAFRKQLDELREHDIVQHIYFGRGEVFDNTDIKLIEIRFGNDVRFLNKDALASKKLITKFEEAERRWRY